MTATTVVRRIAALLAVFLVLMLVGRHTTQQREIFPFYSFDLFSRLPAQDEGAAAVWVEEVTEGPLDEPVPLAGSRWLKGSGVLLANLAVQLLRAEDETRRQELSDAIATNHFKPGVVSWSLRLEVRNLYATEPLDVLLSYPMAWFGAYDPAQTLRWDGAVLHRAGLELPLDASQHGGELETVLLRDDGTLEVRGWAGDRERDRLPELIVAIGPDDEIVAVTGASIRRRDVGRLHGADRLNWAGFRFATALPETDLTVLAVFGDRVLELTRGGALA